MENSMMLKDFITTTLIQICEGVNNAKSKYTVAIAPKMAPNSNSYDTQVQYVEFDLGITETKTSGESGKAEFGISVVQIGVGGKIEKANKTESINRISFKVPIYFQDKDE